MGSRCPGSGKRIDRQTNASNELDFKNFQTSDFINLLQSYKCSVLKFVPKAARVCYAMAFSECVKRVLDDTSPKEAWARLIMPSVCLRKTPRARAQRNKVSLSTIVQRQVTDFNRSIYGKPQQTASTSNTPKQGQSVDLILEKLNVGDVKGAIRLAASNDSFIAPSSAPESFRKSIHQSLPTGDPFRPTIFLRYRYPAGKFYMPYPHFPQEVHEILLACAPSTLRTPPAGMLTKLETALSSHSPNLRM